MHSSTYSYKDFESAFNRLKVAQINRAPYCALIGNSGMGKTTLIRELRPIIQQQDGIILYTSLSQSSSYGFLQMIAETLHLITRQSKQETVKMIIQTLSIMSAHLYVWIDEAQFIKESIFHEIRMLSEASLDKETLFSVMFIGQSELLQRLKMPTMYSVGRRINPIVEINGLIREEISGFVTHYISEKNVNRYSDDSLLSIFEYSVGNPSKILNIIQLCENVYKESELITTEMVSRCIDNHTLLF